MSRDIDPRQEDRDRPDMSRGYRGAAETQRAAVTDIREVFSRELELPRGTSRRTVENRDRSFDLRASEVRILATAGAFRVVPAKDLPSEYGHTPNPRSGDLRHLREQGLIETVPYVVGREKTSLVTLTAAGRDLLWSHQNRGSQEKPQEFYAGIVKPRELSHDARLYEAYLRSAERLRGDGAVVRRVVLDYELKRDYQVFLRDQKRQRRRTDHGGNALELHVQDWARAQGLPVVDGHLHFPDVRIEFERPDGERCVEDVEVVTPHYRGAYATAKGRTGFSCYRIDAGVGGGGGRSRATRRGIAEELLG